MVQQYKQPYLKLIGISLTALLLFACDGSTTQQVINQVDSAEAIPTGALVISGSLVNGDDPENDSILDNQQVAIVRNDGVIVAEGRSQADGNFELDLAVGALVIDTGYDPSGLGLQQSAAPPTTSDFGYTLEAKIPNDGNGKALGLRKRLDLRASQLGSGGNYDAGQNSLREVSAIVGSISFAEQQASAAGVDVFIPGKPYFVRTGDDGAFSLLFVPPGTYSIRLTKGLYIKDVAVTVTPGKTLALGDIVVAANERNPLPLSETLLGTWSATCYYNDIAIPVDLDNPLTGTVVITSFEEVTLTNDSCVFRTRGSTSNPSNYQNLRILGDGIIVTEFGPGTFFFNRISSYNNNQIAIDVDSSSLGGGPMIEVWQRVGSL